MSNIATIAGTAVAAAWYKLKTFCKDSSHHHQAFHSLHVLAICFLADRYSLYAVLSCDSKHYAPILPQQPAYITFDMAAR